MKVPFKQVPVGGEFFDPDSGDDFLKVSDRLAEMISGSDFSEGEQVAFNPEEIVEVES